LIAIGRLGTSTKRQLFTSKPLLAKSGWEGKIIINKPGDLPNSNNYMIAFGIKVGSYEES